MCPALRVFKIRSRKIPPQNELGKKTEIRNSHPIAFLAAKQLLLENKADGESRVPRMI